MSLLEHRGWWLMKHCPLCYIKHQHIPTLFTDLMHIIYLNTSSYRHHIRPPQLYSDDMVSTQKGGRDGMREKEEKSKEQSQNSTQWNTAHLPVTESKHAGWACWLPGFLPLLFCFLLSAQAAFCKAEHTEANRSIKLELPTGLNSLSNLSGHLKVFQPCYREW